MDDMRMPKSARPSPRRSVGVVAAAAAVALAVWTAARMLGMELTVGRSGDLSQVGAVDMVVAVVVAGFAAWATQALLARRNAARWWPFVGSTALAISMNGPGYLSNDAAAIVLMFAHLAVGFVLIAGLSGVSARTMPAWCHWPGTTSLNNNR